MQILSRYTSGTVLLVLWHLSLQQPEAKVKLPSMKVLCSFTSSNEHKWWHTKQCIVKLPKIPTLHSFYNFMLLSILIFINEFLFLFFVCILVYFVGGGGGGGVESWGMGWGRLFLPNSARSHCSTVCVYCESYLKEQSECSSNSLLNKKTQDARQVTLSVHSTFPLSTQHIPTQYTAHSHSVHSTFPLSTQHIPLPCPLPGNNAPEYTVNHTMHQKTLSITQCTRKRCQSDSAPEYTVNHTMHQKTLSIRQCTRIHCQSHNAPENTVNQTVHQNTLSITQCTRKHCQSDSTPEYTVNHTMHQKSLSINAPENTVNRTMHQKTLSINAPEYNVNHTMYQNTLSVNAPENTVNRTMHQNTLSIAQCLLHQKTLSITQCLLHKYINKTLLINLPCQSFG